MQSNVVVDPGWALLAPPPHSNGTKFFYFDIQICDPVGWRLPPPQQEILGGSIL